MLLIDRDILAARAAGDLIIEPFDRRQLGANSYDVRLGNWYYTPTRALLTFDPTDAGQVRAFWGESVNALVDRRSPGRVVIPPGETILAHTMEVVGSVRGSVPMMGCRSSLGRSAISVCKCAGVGDLGYIDQWTMEVTNHSRATILLPVGLRVAQMTFHAVADMPIAPYEGKYGLGAMKGESWTPERMLPKLHLDWDALDLPDGVYDIGVRAAHAASLMAALDPNGGGR